ncbi:ABC transporter substrate-binding protein [Flavobacterium faecale]|uniref:ABC transporter substrate-binding protein n=1 Tax=Flavobacterium faecale TaxID=1355330 RepID=A0A2S1LH23_9FLAO|nr:ABC transporter substrate-binding protein [Flavobacterium faecale]AWG23080.1 ABC transporter substrate-binding protein [Flavobacterium faecale]
MVLANKMLLCSFILLLFVQCKKEPSQVATSNPTLNTVQYASSLSIYKNEGYSIIKVSTPWPNATQALTYILKEKQGTIPDSLQKYPLINVPLNKIVVTSTTIIPYLEILGVEDKLVGFPHTDYISSPKTRLLIDQNKIQDVGQNELLNTEQIIDLSPDLIVTFSMDDHNPTIKNLEKSGLKTLIQADWMEQSPLGKAEWIKLYGALFGKEKEAKKQFDKIVSDYKNAMALTQNTRATATILYGSMYEDQWFVPKGNSWSAQFMKDAKANYLWAETEGSGSLALSFEVVLDKAQTAQFWITSSSFKNLKDMSTANPHYAQFDAFKHKNVYTFEAKLGATGGAIYYELAPSRPDLVLKDYIKIVHPDLLKDYTFTFAQKLQ